MKNKRRQGREVEYRNSKVPVERFSEITISVLITCIAAYRRADDPARSPRPAQIRVRRGPVLYISSSDKGRSSPLCLMLCP